MKKGASTKDVITVAPVEIDLAEDNQRAADLALIQVDIETPEEYQRWADTRQVVKQNIKALEDLKREKCRPFNEGLAGLRKFFQKPIDKYQDALKNIDSGLLEYTRKQEEIRRAAEEKARKEAAAAEKARQEAEKARQEAEEKGEEAPVFEVYEPEPVVIPQEIPKAEGISMVTRWKGKVTDLNAVPKDYLIQITKVDQGALDSLATRTKGQLQVPGVEFYTEVSPRSTGRR